MVAMFNITVRSQQLSEKIGHDIRLSWFDFGGDSVCALLSTL